MKSLLDLIKALYGPKALSSTLGTRTNVVRLPTGKLQRYLKEDLNIEGASDNAAINVYKEMEQLVPDIPKMNDAERLIFEGNLRRLKNKLEASGLLPKQKVTKEGEVIGMESKEKITGDELKKLTEEKGTINPPTTVSGQLEAQGKKLENIGKKIDEEFIAGKKKKTVSEILDEYFSSYKSMKEVEDQALVRAVAREIMYQDLKAGKLKVPKDVEDVIRGIGPANRDVLDEFNLWYGFDAIEDLHDNAHRFYTMTSPKEAVDFIKQNEYSNWEKVYQPRKKPIKDFMTPEEFKDMLKDATVNKYGVISPKASESLDKETAKEIYDFYLKRGDRDLIIKEINEISEGKKFDVYKVEDRNKIIDILSDVLKKLGPPMATGTIGLDYLAEKSALPKTEGGTQQSLGLDYLMGTEPPEGGYADGGRIGFKSGSGGKKILDLINKANQKLKGKKSMETVNPKTGEVTVPEKPVGTVMESEPVIRKYNQDIIKAADEIYPNYDDPKIAADQIVDSYAQMKYGLEDQYGLSNKERMDLYTQAYDYVMDYNRGAIGKTTGKSINISDETFGKALADFARENDPEGFAKVSKYVDRLNELGKFRSGQEIFENYNLETYHYLTSEQISQLLNQLKNPYKVLDKERDLVKMGFTSTNFEGVGIKNLDEINFKVDKKQLETYLEDLYNKKQVEEAQNELFNLQYSGREPNAVGGRVGYAEGSDGAPSITLDSYEKAPDNIDKYPVKLGNLELGIMGAMRSGKSTPNPYVKINTADRNFTVRGKYNVPDTGISLLGDIGDVRSRSRVNIDVPQYDYKETFKDVMRLNPYSVGIEYAPDQNRNINLRYDDRGNVTLRGEARFAKGGLGYLMGL